MRIKFNFYPKHASADVAEDQGRAITNSFLERLLNILLPGSDITEFVTLNFEC